MALLWLATGMFPLMSRYASAKMPQEMKMALQVFRNENFSRTSVFDFKIREILISGFVE